MFILCCSPQNDSVAESNEEEPAESLNMLLTDISLVSLMLREETEEPSLGRRQ